MVHRIIRSWYTLAVDGWAVTFGTARRGPGRAVAPPSTLLAVPNVTTHASTASVPITVLLYDGPLLCGFNVAIKWLSYTRNFPISSRVDRPYNSVALPCYTVIRFLLTNGIKFAAMQRILAIL